MKRHEALKPLSREHHGALLLAQVLRNDVPDYKGMPSLVADKAAYALETFRNTLQPHFIKEEQVLAKLKNCSAELDKMIDEIRNEHMVLTASFLSLAEAIPAEKILHELGEKLIAHVRKEERVLFPLIETSCSDQLLDEIKVLHKNEGKPKKDITGMKDIIKLVDLFYEKVKADDQIGHFFTDVVKVNWEKHLPVMYRFWDNALFFTGVYEGKPLEIHQHLHRLSGLTEAHFQRWIRLFTETVNELFDGEKAELAKERAISISTIMQMKLFKQNNLPAG